MERFPKIKEFKDLPEKRLDLELRERIHVIMIDMDVFGGSR